MSDSNNLSRRRFLQATGGAAAAVALAGCSGNPDQQQQQTTTTAKGGTDTTDSGKDKPTNTVKNPNPDAKLKEILSGTITTFDPIAATDTASGIVIRQMFEGLMVYPDAKTEPKPKLAEKYERKGTTYTFTLKDAEFHNGKKVTADDFVYAFERLAASKNSRRAYFILESLGVKHESKTVTQDGKKTKQYVPNTLAVKAVDEKTLELTLKAPFHSTLAMLSYSSFAAVPKGIVGDIKGAKGTMPYDEFASKNPIGSGPFKFEMWQQGTQAEVSRFENYHGEKASIAGIHWQVIEKTNPRYTYAMEKNADMFVIPNAKYDPKKVSIEKEADTGGKLGNYGPVRNNETLNYYRITPLNTRYIGFNMNNVPKAVRQAFAYATNQKLLVDRVFKGQGDPATHLTPPSIFPGEQSGYDSHAKKYPYSATKTELEKARQSMEKAGYGENKRAPVELTLYQSATWKQLGQILRDQLASAYIDVKLQQVDFSTMLQRGRNGKLQAYTLGWVADWPAPDNFLQLLYPPETDTRKPGPVSYINWTSENGTAAQKATSAYETVLENQAPTDKAKKIRNEAYLKIEEANWEDVGFVNISHEWGTRYWYDWVEVPPYGAMGTSRQVRDSVKIGKRS